MPNDWKLKCKRYRSVYWQNWELPPVNGLWSCLEIFMRLKPWKQDSYYSRSKVIFLREDLAGHIYSEFFYLFHWIWCVLEEGPTAGSLLRVLRHSTLGWFNGKYAGQVAGLPSFTTTADFEKLNFKKETKEISKVFRVSWQITQQGKTLMGSGAWMTSCASIM